MAFTQAVGLAAGALGEPSGLAAVRFLHEHSPKEGHDFQGLVNQGMFAGHTLRGRVRDLPSWKAASAKGDELRTRGGRALVEGLGFTIEAGNTAVNVLRAPNDQARAVAIFLDRDERPESESGRFGGTSALSQAFTRAERDNVPFVMFTRGPEIRLYAVTRHHGVGRKGQAETYVQANVSLLGDDETGFLPLIFSADALLDGGTFEQILAWSRDFSADLSARLRDRVYTDVVPDLALAVAQEHGWETQHTERSLEDIYEETLVILFRLLFLAYAEDRGLLPYVTNADYRRNSLKATARALASRANEGKGWNGITTHALWNDVGQLFEAIDRGNDAWSVPAYNGGLFTADGSISPAGAAIDEIKIDDEHFGPALTALLTELGEDGVTGPVDFRSLSVRDFGTIYEGLLESSLSVATTDLTLDARENYVPAAGEDVEVPKGNLYFHNRSGARKSTGSYFTKDFAVEHLLERALEPSLHEHLGRLTALLAAGRDDEAANAFFDFRCADLSMGSGHFLVAAVDHVEKRLAQFLDENPVPAVEAELDRLRAAAINHLGDTAAGYEIERRQLLRRQIARRCVYGIDRNHIAVELARLSLWVHTFVPGLPLSFLDHNLVQGDSLTGIGTIDEAVEYLTDPREGARSGQPRQGSVFEKLINDWLDETSEPLIRLGRASDATRAELKEVRHAADEALARAEPVRKLFDLVAAMRRGETHPLAALVTTQDVELHPGLADAEAVSAELNSLHLPVAFPEVFLRDRPGFDCLLGNPPWEKVKVEEHGFWGLRYPGLRGASPSVRAAAIVDLAVQRPDLVAELTTEIATTHRLKETLIRGPYPGIGRTDPDLFKAFAWRFWQLTREGGYIGIVLPRTALSSSGTAGWREEVLAGGVFEDVAFVVNAKGWMFDEVEQRYTIGLVTIRKGTTVEPMVRLGGPFANLSSFLSERDTTAAEFAAGDFASWSTGAAFPVMPSAHANLVFLKLRQHPRLSTSEGWRARPVRELHATDDKHLMEFEPSAVDNLWPIYKGASFNLWEPDTGTYFAWADPQIVTQALYEKRFRQQRRERSAYSEFPLHWARDKSTLPCLAPRIAFRDVARATDTRTVVASLVPPSVFLSHTAYFMLWPKGDKRDEAYLLGVLSSIPLDWYARRFVEAHVNIEILNAFPVPRLEREDPIRREIEVLAGTLAAVDERYRAWADEVGVPVGRVSALERDGMSARLDALVAVAYGLQRDDVVHVFETFHVGWDSNERLERTLAEFEAL